MESISLTFQHKSCGFVGAWLAVGGILQLEMQRFFRLPSFSSAKRWSALLGLALLSPFALSGTEPAHADPLAVVEGQSLDVRADRLDVDIAKGTAVLQGNVRAVLGELEVECG